MKTQEISQLPVKSEEEFVGSITESSILSFLLENPMINADKNVSEIMGPSFPVLDIELQVDELGSYIDKNIPAVMVLDDLKNFHIITYFDIIQAVSKTIK
jgi:cystathionine beta-synthase